MATQLPPNWQQAVDPNGKTYYQNVVTKETSWTPPQAQAQVYGGQGAQMGTVVGSGVQQVTQGIAVVQQVVVVDPATAFNWMQDHKTFFIEQKRGAAEVLEAMTGIEMANTFYIRAGGENGQIMLTAKEEGDCCARQCCGAKIAPFQMNIFPLNQESGQPLMVMERPFNCTDTQNCFPCCCACDCNQIMFVRNPDGSQIGFIKEEYGSTCWAGKFTIYKGADEEGAVPIARITCPCTAMWAMCCCNDVIFDISDSNGQATIGQVMRKWKCQVLAVAGDVDHMQVDVFDPTSVPDVDDKKLLVAMAIHFKYVFFEDPKDDGQNGIAFG